MNGIVFNCKNVFFRRLIGDRELSLYDGSQLLRADRYESLKATSGLSDEQLSKK